MTIVYIGLGLGMIVCYVIGIITGTEIKKWRR